MQVTQTLLIFSQHIFFFFFFLLGHLPEIPDFLKYRNDNSKEGHTAIQFKFKIIFR